MTDIPEPERESPERSTNHVEPATWDIGNGTFPTALTTNRFDIVSNGSLTVEPVLPVDTTMILGRDAGTTISNTESLGTTLKTDSKNVSLVSPVITSAKMITDSSPQPNIPLESQGSSFNSASNNAKGENIDLAPNADSRNVKLAGPIMSSGGMMTDSSPQAKIPLESQSSSFDSAPNKAQMNIPSHQRELVNHTPSTLENSTYQPKAIATGSDLIVAGPTPKLTDNTSYSQNAPELDLVTPKISFSKTVANTLPTLELIRAENRPEKHAEQLKVEPMPRQSPEISDYDAKVQAERARVLAKMGTTVESALGTDATRIINTRHSLELASNIKIEENRGRIRLSLVEGKHSFLNFREFVRSASELFSAKSILNQRQHGVENLVRPSNQNFINKLDLARHLNSKASLPTIFNIQRPESLTTPKVSAIDTNFTLLNAEKRTPVLIGQVKEVLANPRATINNTTINSDALSAQGILRSQFTSVRGEGLTPLSFTVKDARASMNVGDPRYPGYLEIGRRKKKKKNGEEDDECATTLSPESCRYISGLELGLLIALAGIARKDGPDRTNRTVVKENGKEKSSSSLNMDLFQACDLISESIKLNKIEKGLSSNREDNQFKSSIKIELKNQIRKLKEEMRELSSKDVEKLESSDTKEELLDRLSKMVAKNEKRLFSKRQLSSFGATQKEIATQTNNQAASHSSQISNYRPLWLVTANDSLTRLAEQIYQDPDVAWLIADMNISRIKESYMNGKRVIELQSRQQIELPIQEDIDLFKTNKPKDANAERLITIVQVNQLDKELINSQLQALQFKRKAIGTT